MAYKYRDLESTTWPSGTDIETSVLESPDAFNLCKTYDDNIQVVYETGDLLHRNYDGSSWSSPAFTIDSDPLQETPKGISNTTNDFFITWMHDGSNYIRYRQYDAVPGVPGNLALTPVLVSGTYYPKVTWDLNMEPDVKENTTNGYQIARRTSIDGGDWSDWSIIASLSGAAKEYTDLNIPGAGRGDNQVEYKIRARDISANISDYSSPKKMDYGQDWGKIAVNFVVTETIDKYELLNNYPNPFNPSTKITFSIPEDARVIVKAYDVTGQEVIELINSDLGKGIYHFTFDGTGLASGIYFYDIKAIKGEKIVFSDVKKMLLTK